MLMFNNFNNPKAKARDIVGLVVEQNFDHSNQISFQNPNDIFQLLLLNLSLRK